MPDQAPLFDAIERARRLGLSLVSVVPLPLHDGTTNPDALPVVEQVPEPGIVAQEFFDAVTQQLFSASLIREMLPQIWAANPRRQRSIWRTCGCSQKAP